MRADNVKEETMTRIRTLLGLAALFVLLLLTTAVGCEPQAGDSCDSPGGYTTRVKDGRRTSLSCQPSGIDRNGNQEYRWVKA